MMVDIFSSFDPATNFFFSFPIIFWVMILLYFSFIASKFWVSPTSLMVLINAPTLFISTQLFRSKGHFLKGFSILITFLFIFFMIINLFGLIPYIFSTTSHLVMTLSFGAPLWLGLILSSALNSPKEFSASLLPSGAPSWLSPPLILIETISILVRPLTLSFRLAANMSAGHIVLGLINMYTSNALNSPSSFSILLLISILYTLFEFGICLIQAYIFCLLLSLYSDDHTS